jgi:thiol-disulfide isomerase/thioredoxin
MGIVHAIIILLVILVLYYSTKYVVNWFTNRVEVILFYSDRCRHCQNMMPEWTRFEDITNGGDISVRKISSYEKSDLSQMYNPTGMVPMIVRVDENGPIAYRGPRNAEAFYKFAVFGIGQ